MKFHLNGTPPLIGQIYVALIPRHLIAYRLLGEYLSLFFPRHAAAISFCYDLKISRAEPDAKNLNNTRDLRICGRGETAYHQGCALNALFIATRRQDSLKNYFFLNARMFGIGMTREECEKAMDTSWYRLIGP